MGHTASRHTLSRAPFHAHAHTLAEALREREPQSPYVTRRTRNGTGRRRLKVPAGRTQDGDSCQRTLCSEEVSLAGDAFVIVTTATAAGQLSCGVVFFVVFFVQWKALNEVMRTKLGQTPRVEYICADMNYHGTGVIQKKHICLRSGFSSFRRDNSRCKEKYVKPL